VRIALGSDEQTALTDALADDLRGRGHEVVLVGPPGGQDLGWADVGRRVGELVAGGGADTAVLCCWTGTGVSIAANKVAGIRAALCTDAETARGARRWNDANVLAMSLKRLGPDVAVEVLAAFLDTDGPDPDEADNIARLSTLEHDAGAG